MNVWTGGRVDPSYVAPMEEFSCAYDVPWVIDGSVQPEGEAEVAADEGGHSPDEAAHNMEDEENDGVGWENFSKPGLHPPLSDYSSEGNGEPMDGDEEEEDDEDDEDAEEDDEDDEDAEEDDEDDEDAEEDDEDDEDADEDDEMTFANPISDTSSSTDSPRPRYVAVRSLTIRDAKRLWGRGTVVLEVISLEDWKNKNEEVSHCLGLHTASG
jgi:hypothetical protein